MNTKEELKELIEQFDYGMLVTKDAEGAPRARPMALAGSDDEGTLWFATSSESGKVEEIAGDNRVGVTLQGGGRFVSISARARTIRERSRMKDLWKEAWRPWFPNGPDDPKLVLLRLDPIEAEYWDTGGLKGVKYAFEALKAAAKGERAPDGETEWHHKVQMH